MDTPYLHDCQVFKFDGKNNFEDWHQYMKCFFNVVGLWSIVETGFEEPPKGTTLTGDAAKQLEKNRQLDYKARYYLTSKVELHVSNKFLHAKSTKEAWRILVNSHRGSAEVKKVKLQDLRRQYELAQMKPIESVKEFIIRITNSVNDMRTNGEVLDEVKVDEKILRSLGIKFYTKKVVLEATKDHSPFTLDDLEGELVTYEMSLTQDTPEIVEEALQAKVNQPKAKEEISYPKETNQRYQNFRGRGRGRSNYRDRRGRDNFSYQQRNSNNFWKEQQGHQNFQRHDKSKIQCYNCGKFEHYESEYWSNKFGNKDVHAKMAEIMGINKRLYCFLILGLKKLKGMSGLLIRLHQSYEWK
uniref:Uncharacterized protein n=2 Tax=Nicotiana TaxID=4085 RepID=A0A1S4AKY9_TOBAC|nr:PREDICTED: uncharacterized protein LOC104210023 [Nicotiana sylvestris]XP_016477377.1 PREDICTED: uncharacterized protein LOC107798859 [Nicotiana tabacum]